MMVDRSLLGEPPPIFIDRPPEDGFVSVPEAVAFFGRQRFGATWPEPNFAWACLWRALRVGDPYKQAQTLPAVEGLPAGREIVRCLWYAFDQVVCALCWEEVRAIVCRNLRDSSGPTVVEKKEVAFHYWCSVFEPPERSVPPIPATCTTGRLCWDSVLVGDDGIEMLVYLSADDLEAASKALDASELPPAKEYTPREFIQRKAWELLKSEGGKISNESFFNELLRQDFAVIRRTDADGTKWIDIGKKEYRLATIEKALERLRKTYRRQHPDDPENVG